MEVGKERFLVLAPANTRGKPATGTLEAPSAGSAAASGFSPVRAPSCPAPPPQVPAGGRSLSPRLRGVPLSPGAARGSDPTPLPHAPAALPATRRPLTAPAPPRRPRACAERGPRRAGGRSRAEPPSAAVPSPAQPWHCAGGRPDTRTEPPAAPSAAFPAEPAAPQQHVGPVGAGRDPEPGEGWYQAGDGGHRESAQMVSGPRRAGTPRPRPPAPPAPRAGPARVRGSPAAAGGGEPAAPSSHFAPASHMKAAAACEGERRLHCAAEPPPRRPPPLPADPDPPPFTAGPGPGASGMGGRRGRAGRLPPPVPTKGPRSGPGVAPPPALLGGNSARRSVLEKRKTR